MKIKELCESRNSNRKNLRAENQMKLALERLHLKIGIFENFSFEANLIFYENL